MIGPVRAAGVLEPMPPCRLLRPNAKNAFENPAWGSKTGDNGAAAAENQRKWVKRTREAIYNQ
jgi:hypothetical protein